ncbi:hypothetical protein [Taibaiella soli]|uniref:Uncharacterized protein n=1 Tax=Taibaiella soli TaxID=1649169 RepID=A0A2W2AG31_9BACT|nr:hypothetical protein [Taibaiella soli]PZF71190.1 hypothetical protein DN068_19645 [Taibaiella soli]
MRRFRIILVFLSIAQISAAQHFRDSKFKISKTEKKLIAAFWTDFKEAINSQNKSKLAALIYFPFNCEYCGPVNPASHFYPPVTKTEFDQKFYAIFFDPKLVKTANGIQELTDILEIAKNEDGSDGGFMFSYTTIDQSQNTKGRQCCFCIAKINQKYVITSTWTFP